MLFLCLIVKAWDELDRVEQIKTAKKKQGTTKESTIAEGHCSSARSLLKHAGSWVGNDLKNRLREVYATRSKQKYLNKFKSLGYKRARRRQLKIIRQGYDLGTNGALDVPRDELHDR
jgi:hypothetical protein